MRVKPYSVQRLIATYHLTYLTSKQLLASIMNKVPASWTMDRQRLMEMTLPQQ